jgi:Glu-tRNA(Gln) amidotransferase subunit E-like FAD-binding protein
MAKRRKGLGGLIGKLAVAVGLAAVVSNLEKQAKEEGKDITDVAADKVNSLVDSVKSGELQKNVLEKADKVINGTKESLDKAVESVKSGEIKDKANEVVDSLRDSVDNLRDGVVDLFDGTGTNAPEEEKEESEDTPEE